MAANGVDQVRRDFEECFGRPSTVVVRSPGRVNLIGDHTDYNEGWVFPAALNLGTTVAARPRSDRLLRTIAQRLNAEDETTFTDLRPGAGPEWTRYVRGVAALLQEQGCEPTGADLLVTGNLPLGGGLSSSASLEMGVALALAELAGHTIEPKVMARLGQRAENEIVGVQSGIMDQLAVACGKHGHALLIDCRSLDLEPVAISLSTRILILDSGVPRTLAGSAYNRRRAECDSALQKLRAVQPDLKALRDVSIELLSSEAYLLTPMELRRVRHVVTEDARVLEGAMALRCGNGSAFGQLMVASHDSLRDDYEVSGSELDTLVSIALESRGVLGARLTGAGFGGCAVALVEASDVDQAAQEIPARYQRSTGRSGMGNICEASDGAHVIWADSRK